MPTRDPVVDDDDDIVELDFSEAVDDWLDDEDEPVEHETLTASQAQRIVDHRVYGAASMMHLPPIKWFIGNLIPEGPITLVHGTTGSRKSFIVLDWMLSAANEYDWHGHSVAPGNFLYVAGEGLYGMPKRIKAWAGHHDRDPATLEGDYMGVPLNLFETSDFDLKLWRSFVAMREYEYVVFDTLHTVMPGGEENSAKDIGRVYKHAREIAGNAKIIFVHHEPKALKGGVRGSSSIRDDADISVGLDGDPGAMFSVLTPDKVRDAKSGWKLTVNFAEANADDELQRSLYVTSLGSQKGVRPEHVAGGYAHLPEDQRLMLAHMGADTFRSKTALAKSMGGNRNRLFETINAMLEQSLIYDGDNGLQARMP